jgi:hypothetical protein
MYIFIVKRNKKEVVGGFQDIRTKHTQTLDVLFLIHKQHGEGEHI